MAHARLSPSSAERWMTCAGSVPLSDGVVDEGSEHAAEGTAAHELAERILLGADGAALVGQRAENGVEWTAEMLTDVMRYVQAVRDIVVAPGGTLLVEQRVAIGHLTGEGKWTDPLTGDEVPKGTEGAVWDPAKGTADTIGVLPRELVVMDLKFGRGVVVEADNNRQLMIYALGALDIFDLTHGPFARVRMVISQPRLGALSEWTCTVDELLAFGQEVKDAATLVGTVTELHRTLGAERLVKYLHPSEKACKFCKVKATCPKLQSEVLEMFDTVDPNADIVARDDQEREHADASGETSVHVLSLAEAMGKLPLVEAWAKAVRARVESELLAGRDVPGWKLVQGRKGPRAWGNPDEAEALLKGFKLRVEDMYDLKLISPTTAGKLHDAKTIGPRQWTKLQALITQSDGSPSVAPASDKRPAIQIAAVTDEFESCSDVAPPVAETADDLL